MNLFLVNCDPLNPAGRPAPDQIRAMGFRGVRWVYRNSPTCLNFFNGCEREGLLTLLVVARESLGPHTWQDFPITEITNQYQPWAFQIGNEPDAIYNPGNKDNSVAHRQSLAPSSWVMDPDEYHEFHSRYALHFRTHDPDAMVATAGMCSGIPSWFFEVAHGDRLDYNRLGVHPYSKDAREAETLLEDYAGDGGYPLISEWNRPASQIGTYVSMLNRHDSWDSAWFCWSNQMVNGFGLYDHDKLTAEGHAMSAALGGVVPTPVPTPPPADPGYVLGFAKFHAKYPDQIGPARFPEFYPRPGTALQQSENGVLLWDDAKGFTFLHHDNYFILWDGK